MKGKKHLLVLRGSKPGTIIEYPAILLTTTVKWAEYVKQTSKPWSKIASFPLPGHVRVRVTVWV
jgi:hypothetical protein